MLMMMKNQKVWILQPIGKGVPQEMSIKPGQPISLQKRKREKSSFDIDEVVDESIS
jgi:hypothetical protein